MKKLWGWGNDSYMAAGVTGHYQVKCLNDKFE